PPAGRPATPRRPPARRAATRWPRLWRSAGAPRGRAGNPEGRYGQPLAQRRDLREQLGRLDRLHHVVLGPLAHPPDLVGLLSLGAADDDRDVLGRFVGRQRARRLEAVLARHHHVHEDEVGLRLLHLGERLFGAGGAGHLVAGLGQHVGEVLAVRRRVVYYENRLDRHGMTFQLARGVRLIVSCTAWIRPSFVNGLVR